MDQFIFYYNQMQNPYLIWYLAEIQESKHFTI